MSNAVPMATSPPIGIGTSSPHGSISRYTRGCRCDACRGAWSVYYRRVYRRGLAERAARGEVEVPHGTTNGYCNYMCRCGACRAAVRDAQRELMRRYATAEGGVS